MLAGAGMAVLAAGAFTAIGVSAAAGNVQESTMPVAGGGSSSGVASAAGGAFYNAASRAAVQE